MANLKQIRQTLENRKIELEKRILSINADISHSVEPLSKDWSEQATERENDEVLEALGLASQQELQQIKVALTRITNGNYQNCSVCDEPIPFERLLLVPQTTHCTRCAEEIEAAAR